MDQATIGYVSYRWHHICNPFSLDQLARTLAYADLKPGDRAVDIGCGNAVVAAWMADRYGLQLTGLERYPAMADLARQTAAKPRSQGEMEIIEGPARDYLAQAGQHRLVSMIGAVDVIPGLRRPTDIITALMPSIAPGGWLLWGDPFWKTPPSPRVTAAFAAERFDTLAGWMAAGQAAGLTPHYAAVSTEADWEEFIWRMSASLEAWAEEHGPSDAAVAVRQRAAMSRALYLEEGREGVGFGLYLFRRPIA
jgi:trans-aconitate methyltransferase